MSKKLRRKLLITFEIVFIVSIIVFILFLWLLWFWVPAWVLTIPLWFTALSVIAIIVVLRISPFDPNKKITWNEATNDMIMSGKAFYEQGFGKNEMFGENMTYDKAVEKYNQDKKD